MGDDKRQHLEFTQNAINRMAGNSFKLKTWTVLLSVLPAFFAQFKESGWHGIGVIAPLLAFWGLDGYFLAQERLFRSLYDRVRTLDNDQIDYSMDPRDFRQTPRQRLAKIRPIPYSNRLLRAAIGGSVGRGHFGGAGFVVGWQGSHIRPELVPSVGGYTRRRVAFNFWSGIMGRLIIGILLIGAIALSVACGPSEAEKTENQRIIDQHTAWINLLTDTSLTVSVGCLTGEGNMAFDEIDRRRSLRVDGVTRYPYEAVYDLVERFYGEHPNGGVYLRDLCAVDPMYDASEIEKSKIEIARRQTLP